MDESVNGRVVAIGERRDLKVNGFTATIVAECTCGSKIPLVIPVHVTSNGGGDIPQVCPSCKYEWKTRDIKFDIAADPPVFKIGCNRSKQPVSLITEAKTLPTQ